MPSSGDWTVTAEPGGSTITGTGPTTTGTFTGLSASTTYTFKVTNSDGTSPASADVTIDAVPLALQYRQYRVLYSRRVERRQEQ